MILSVIKLDFPNICYNKLDTEGENHTYRVYLLKSAGTRSVPADSTDECQEKQKGEFVASSTQCTTICTNQTTRRFSDLIWLLIYWF